MPAPDPARTPPPPCDRRVFGRSPYTFLLQRDVRAEAAEALPKAALASGAHALATHQIVDVAVFHRGQVGDRVGERA